MKPDGVAPREPNLWTVLTPKWRSALARLRQEREGSGPRMLLLILIGAGFWSAAFGIAYRVLRYFHEQQEVGAFLAAKGLSIVLLSFASLLLLSNIITSLSAFFLARDLDLLVSSPVDWLRLYLAKLGETIVHSSWMVVLMAVPIFTAYGIVYHGGWLFPLVAAAAFIPYIVLPAVLGSAITLLLVNIFPARRARDILSLVALGAAAGLVLLFRIIRPERLARPEEMRNLLDYLVTLQAPTSPMLPSEWASHMVMNWLTQVADPLPVLLLWTTAPAFVVLGAILHKHYYAHGFTKAQEGAGRTTGGRVLEATIGRTLAALPPSKREFILKDLKIFFRDTQQWSQLILLGVLLVVYLFNIKSLPLFSGEKTPVFLVTVLVFLNQGLAGFVLAAIAARFIFPAVSLEGKQMWLLRSSPLDLKSLLWSKYWTGTLPLLALAVAITAGTNILLRASDFMMILSLVTVVLLTFAIAALALAFGAYYPRFDTENTAQIPTGIGGLMFMMTAIILLGAVISIEAYPVLAHVRAEVTGKTTPIGTHMLLPLAIVALVCGICTIMPLKIGLERMEAMEF